MKIAYLYRMVLLFLALCCTQAALAVSLKGIVLYHNRPVPGVRVILRQGVSAPVAETITDQQGVFAFDELSSGLCILHVEMYGFVSRDLQLEVAGNDVFRRVDLSMLSVEKIQTDLSISEGAQESLPVKQTSHGRDQFKVEAKSLNTGEDAASTAPANEEAEENASAGFLINGSQNNAATSIYSLAPAFGNHRSNLSRLYNGSFGILEGNSALNARPYSLTGLVTPEAAYNQTSLVATLGGPIRIPGVIRRGPIFFIGYQWTRSGAANIVTGRVPTLLERAGDLSGLLDSKGSPINLYDPFTGQGLSSKLSVSPQAAALLKLFPLPNVAGSAKYNYQVGILNSTHTDALESRINRQIGNRDHLSGSFAFRSQRSNASNLFRFIDTTDTLGVNTDVSWSHRYRHRLSIVLAYKFSRLRTEVRPEFAGRTNVSANAGITGNLQDTRDWGPPGLVFANGVTTLNDAQSAFQRNRTDGFSFKVNTVRRRHNLVFGGDFRRQEFNELGQQNPRGEFAFTGEATAGAGSSGSDMADFLLGIPDASAIAYGNADKYFRQSVYDFYFTDEWRLRSNLTINAGIRWDYGAPMTELKNRLVNLDIATRFTMASPVVATNPIGSLTGSVYPTSLLHSDHRGFAPRVGISWRPINGSTLIIRTGYGTYFNTSIYLSSVEALSQQAPLSTSLSVVNSRTCALTLATGFPSTCASAATNTFAIDPRLRVGYAQNWSLSMQRDMPWALVGSVSYLGTKGTHGMQKILPNSYPLGVRNPCASCTSGYIYLTSGANSWRHAGQLQLRRRLRAGLAASLDYTWSKTIDDGAQLGGAGANSASNSLLTQDWRNPGAERSLSGFDQRHIIKLDLQYTTGMGIGGGTLMSGWRGRAFKEWTMAAQGAAGSGFPLSPVYMATTPGTALTGGIRPMLTGASLYNAPAGYYLNAAAYSAPTTGVWGNAGRNSIKGPNQLTLNASLARTFRIHQAWSFDLRMDASNVLNHVTYGGWNTTSNSTTFGLPSSANPMRSVQCTGRMRF